MCARIAFKARTRSFPSMQGLKLQAEILPVYTVTWIRIINGNPNYWSGDSRGARTKLKMKFTDSGGH